ncbi:MAG: AI-2E family transporter [Pleurocapsa sp.]
MRFNHWLGLIVLLISFYILWQIQQVVLLLFAAVILATALNRIVQRFQQSRVKRGIAIAITIIILITVIISFFALVVPSLVTQLEELINILPQIPQRLRTWTDWLQAAIPGSMLKQLEESRGLENLIQQIQTWISQLLGNFFVLLNNSLGVVLNTLLFLVLTIMLLANPSQYRRIFILIFPAFYRRRIDEILSECETSLVGWIKGTLITMLLVAFLSFVGLSILGVRLPFVNAMLAGLLEFIPNVGPTLSVILPTSLALLDAPWKAGATILLYVVIQQVESFILVPIIMKKEANLLPVFTILAVVIFASFFGFLGLFLAIPLLIVSQIWLKEILVKDILNKWYPNKTNN